MSARALEAAPAPEQSQPQGQEVYVITDAWERAPKDLGETVIRETVDAEVLTGKTVTSADIKATDEATAKENTERARAQEEKEAAYWKWKAERTKTRIVPDSVVDQLPEFPWPKQEGKGFRFVDQDAADAMGRLIDLAVDYESKYGRPLPFPERDSSGSGPSGARPESREAAPVADPGPNASAAEPIVPDSDIRPGPDGDAGVPDDTRETPAAADSSADASTAAEEVRPADTVPLDVDRGEDAPSGPDTTADADTTEGDTGGEPDKGLSDDDKNIAHEEALREDEARAERIREEARGAKERLLDLYPDEGSTNSSGRDEGSGGEGSDDDSAGNGEKDDSEDAGGRDNGEGDPGPDKPERDRGESITNRQLVEMVYDLIGGREGWDRLVTRAFDGHRDNGDRIYRNLDINSDDRRVEDLMEGFLEGYDKAITPEMLANVPDADMVLKAGRRLAETVEFAGRDPETGRLLYKNHRGRPLDSRLVEMVQRLSNPNKWIQRGEEARELQQMLGSTFMPREPQVVNGQRVGKPSMIDRAITFENARDEFNGLSANAKQFLREAQWFDPRISDYTTGLDSMRDWYGKGTAEIQKMASNWAMAQGMGKKVSGKVVEEITAAFNASRRFEKDVTIPQGMRRMAMAATPNADEAGMRSWVRGHVTSLVNLADGLREGQEQERIEAAHTRLTTVQRWQAILDARNSYDAEMDGVEDRARAEARQRFETEAAEREAEATRLGTADPDYAAIRADAARMRATAAARAEQEAATALRARMSELNATATKRWADMVDRYEANGYRRPDDLAA